MFRDQITKRLSKPGDKLRKVIALTRPKTYTRWVKNEETNHYEEVANGQGFEPVRELSLSAEGESIWNGWTPEQRMAWLKAN